MPASIGPGDTMEFDCVATAELKPRTGEVIRQYEVCVKCLAVGLDTVVLLPFQHPFRLSHKLHTCRQKKFVQVLVHGTCNLTFQLSDHSLTTDSPGKSLSPLNMPQQTLTVDKTVSASYMWDLVYNTDNCLAEVDCVFSMAYRLEGEGEKHSCQYDFSLDNYKTIFHIETVVIPGGENEKQCRVGSMCHMSIHIKYEDGTPDPEQQYMYDIVAESNTWAVCGKSSGVFMLKEQTHEISTDVMPLIPGFLHLPGVRLSEYKVKLHIDEMDKDSGRVSPATVSPLGYGQVYNASLGQQVRVHPTINVSNVEVTIE